MVTTKSSNARGIKSISHPPAKRRNTWEEINVLLDVLNISMGVIQIKRASFLIRNIFLEKIAIISLRTDRPSGQISRIVLFKFS